MHHICSRFRQGCYFFWRKTVTMQYIFRSILILCMVALASGCEHDTKTSETRSAVTKVPDTAAIRKQQEDSLKVLLQKPEIQYHFEHKAVWKTKDSFEGSKHMELLSAINRVDEIHLKRLDSFLVPDKYAVSIANYLPFPKAAPLLSSINKIIIFSYPTQTFAAYEHGVLIQTGPVSMGKKSTPTPEGLFFCNWKSKETRSTVDKSWILKWNFNISNYGGVGFHQYAMPGYPASHSCLRLWDHQAEFLYHWADQWKLQGKELLAKGTPVIVYGAYPFGQPRPWYALAENGKALDISLNDLEKVIAPFMDEIKAAQENRMAVLSGATTVDATTVVDTTRRITEP